ncbi:mechanosensitive ion channel family protein [Brevundimonas sp. S30B]|uniref:mechanosensitive ion channel family protein n=1 Tax=unclassified Brevundimonas TaxID=2622653 RepID=UPI001072B209|nr:MULTISPECIES: mechanosensitive ion channel family protein [unclassified Brevundimonas]QBX38489.1 mechanosensitive ion channel family protein [Brevundimonas sp. MF30-B]TFW02197.1 mechanosensitive ion channel family protein [Brevundimonas sp. S30B]
MQNLNAMRDRLAEYPAAETLIGLALLVAAAFAVDFLVRKVLFRVIRQVLHRLRLDSGSHSLQPVTKTLARLAPAMVVHQGILAVPHIAPAAAVVTRNVASAFMILTVVMALAALLDLANHIYSRRPKAAARPIKGYLEVVKILLYAVATILIIATLIERSPLLLLSGLGALAAVLMLVFKDTILSLVASVQLNSNDMLRVGDWIEMPQLNADGDVVDIALHTVKVQNFDRTITTIPTWRLINESYKNWRGMQDSGGRRIKRSLLIDQSSVRFMDDEDEARLSRFALIDDYLEAKAAELKIWNQTLTDAGRDVVNARRQTNLGAFRAYVESYLRSHARIHQGMTVMVRQLAPSAEGLPLEVYCFTSTTAWAEYEGIQADIFDHLLAILPEFGLRQFQQPSGADFAGFGRQMDTNRAA